MNLRKNIVKKNNLIKVILLLIFISLLIYYFLSPIPISSQTYYVAKNGNDNNPGTEAQPWRTITKATDTLVAGETVYIKEGTYNEKVLINNSGRPGNYITFAAYPGDNVTIDGTGISMGTWDGLIQIYGSSYIKISGFRIINSRFMGIMVTSNYGKNFPTNITIEKNYISNTASSAVFVEDGKGITIDGNEITKVQTLEGLGKQTHETISLVNVDGFEVKNNKLYNNNFGSINAKNGSANGKIHHNDISYHESAGIYVDTWSGGSHNIEIFSNRVHDGRAGGRGIALAIENGGSLKNIKVYNNIIYNNAATGIDISWYNKGTADDILITSNTVYNNGLVDGWGGGISANYSSATNVIIRNNIISKNNHYSIKVKDAAAIIDHNLIDGYMGGQDETKGSYTIEGDPQFINPANADFHLKSTSPAIGMGSTDSTPVTDFDGNARLAGTNYDIGAFEYIPALISTSTPIPILISSPTYYVAKDGNDNNPGTEAQPWRTITKAANTVVAGDTVYVRAGIYNERLEPVNSGSPGNYITFAAYPGDNVTIDGTGISVGTWDGLVQLYGLSYINISGFKIINSKFMGVMVTSNYGKNFPTNITIEKNYISNTASSAIFVEDGKGITIDGNEITKAQTMEGLDKQTHETITLAKVDGFEIKNNKLYNNNFESIVVKRGSSNGKIYKNDVSQHQSAGIYIDAWDEVAHDIEIFSNRVHDGSASGARGISVAVENKGNLKNIRIYNNVVYNNAAIGLNLAWYSNGPIDNIAFINNVVYNNGLVDNWGGGINIQYGSATNVTVSNNIVSQNRNYQIVNKAGANAIITNNLIDGYLGGQDETKGSYTIEGNPQFINPTNADFHLKSTSPAIGNGSSFGAPAFDYDGNSRPSPAGYDIGAFEYKQ